MLRIVIDDIDEIYTLDKVQLCRHDGIYCELPMSVLQHNMRNNRVDENLRLYRDINIGRYECGSRRYGSTNQITKIKKLL